MNPGCFKLDFTRSVLPILFNVQLTLESEKVLIFWKSKTKQNQPLFVRSGPEWKAAEVESV